MLGPNHGTYHIAQQTYGERLDHAARIRMVQKDRHDGSEPFDRQAHRAMTARRLAASLASVILAATVATAAVGTVVAAPNSAPGGGPTLIR
ncbi:MAG: hypothetical protein M3Y29_08485 [Chloroflexota bacterium]|jgi:hypothetical protein|nr:hypothetical protein [Chloroflexota bacterium]